MAGEGVCYPRLKQTFSKPLRSLLAFTLVETMVATLIIGILVALLLPAIMKAKAKGFQTFCTNNLRGVGIGLIWVPISAGMSFESSSPELMVLATAVP